MSNPILLLNTQRTPKSSVLRKSSLMQMMDGYQKDGSPRFKTFYGKTQKEVKLKLKEYQDALISGVQLDTILYFEDWADTWFEGHKDNIAPTT